MSENNSATVKWTPPTTSAKETRKVTCLPLKSRTRTHQIYKNREILKKINTVILLFLSKFSTIRFHSVWDAHTCTCQDEHKATLCCQHLQPMLPMTSSWSADQVMAVWRCKQRANRRREGGGDSAGRTGSPRPRCLMAKNDRGGKFFEASPLLGFSNSSDRVFGRKGSP